jgi:hypothetical protein
VKGSDTGETVIHAAAPSTAAQYRFSANWFIVLGVDDPPQWAAWVAKIALCRAKSFG